MTAWMNRYSLIVAGIMCLPFILTGQTNQYQYTRKIMETTDTSVWQKIDLPIDIYSKINSSGSDLRIYHISPTNDTTERPYIYDHMAHQPTSKDIAFQLLNQTTTRDGKSFTFHLKNEEPINEIHLDLKNSNFDWKVKLEGSNDQNTWATLLDNYRIVALDVPTSQYRFTKLLFQDAKFEYYRMTVRTDEEVKFRQATLTYENEREISYQTINVVSSTQQTNKKKKTTVIDIHLEDYAPIDLVKLNVTTTGDYYRPLQIESLYDSSYVNNKWNYHYQNVYRGTVSSVEDNAYRVNAKKSKNWRITINNNDNPPLQLETPTLSSRVRSLYTKSIHGGQSYLYYGHGNARSPNYDLKYFKNKINPHANTLLLGKENKNPKYSTSVESPLINNEWWLWGLLSGMILILGWASLKMIKGSTTP